jgi:hypothetical protein
MSILNCEADRSDSLRLIIIGRHRRQYVSTFLELQILPLQLLEFGRPSVQSRGSSPNTVDTSSFKLLGRLRNSTTINTENKKQPKRMLRRHNLDTTHLDMFE